MALIRPRDLLLGLALGILGLGLALLPDTGIGQANQAVIRQQGIAFAPASARIAVGGKVVFENRDPFAHNVYSPTAGGTFDIGLQEPGAETSVSFAKAGAYEVRCRIHPKMRAEITVQ